MVKFSIEKTNNPAIIKLVSDDFLVNGNWEFKNIDEAKSSPLAQQLFYLPFVKTVYITSWFIALEKYSIVEWEDVQEEVKGQIEEYINGGGEIVKEEKEKKIAFTVYVESTPNPSVMKFVANKKLVDRIYEFHSIEECGNSPLGFELFKFPYVKEVFFDNNYVSVMKYNITDWDDVLMELREFVRDYLTAGKEVIKEVEVKEEAIVGEMSEYSKKIYDLIDEYVKPAVASDGGNIKFLEYDKDKDVVRVQLQGACSGCPSSRITLKNGIENMLREFLNSQTISVEAVNY